jgi:hypothetical protein
MPQARTIPRGVILFTAIYMAVATVVAVITGNTEFIFYLVAMVVMIVVVMAVHRRVDLHPATLWCLTAWGAAHMAGGLMPIPGSWPHLGEDAVLYNLWLIPKCFKYDQLTHAYGFGVCTWVCWQGIIAATGTTRRTVGLLVLAGLAAIGLGAMNEVIEFAATLTMPETNVGGYLNTGWDLVSNLVGTVIGALWIGLAHRQR